MEENEDKYKFRHYFVRSQRCAGHLMQSGFILLGMAPDREYSRRNIFRFSNSEMLRNAIDEYKNSKIKS